MFILRRAFFYVFIMTIIGSLFTYNIVSQLYKLNDYEIENLKI